MGQISMKTYAPTGSLLSANLHAGDLADRTGTPANTMSSHLTILSRAGLATAHRAGRNIFYRPVPEVIRQLTVFLIEDCCDDRADLCGRLQDDLNDCQRGPERRRAAAGKVASGKVDPT